MPTHPLWRPYEFADLDEVAKARVGGQPPRTIVVVPYDAFWPAQFADLEARIRGALGDRVLALEHVGSTAVRGLSAKSVIDADLTVADSGDESAYVSDLEAAGFQLRIREPERFDHTRFVEPRSEHTATPWSLVGFSGGPRRCIGANMAITEVGLIMAHVLNRYALEPENENGPIPVYSPFLAPWGGMAVRLLNR